MEMIERTAMDGHVELPVARRKPRQLSEPLAWVRTLLPYLGNQTFTRLQLSTLAHDRFLGLRWQTVSNAISSELRQAVKEGRIEIVGNSEPRVYRNVQR